MAWHVGCASHKLYRWYIADDEGNLHRDMRGRVVRYGRRATAEQICDLKNGVHKPNSFYNREYGDS